MHQPIFSHLCCVQARVAGDGNCLFCFEALPARPTIQLACDAGHFVHLSCAKKRLQVAADDVLLVCMTAPPPSAIGLCSTSNCDGWMHF